MGLPQGDVFTADAAGKVPISATAVEDAPLLSQPGDGTSQIIVVSAPAVEDRLFAIEKKLDFLTALFKELL